MIYLYHHAPGTRWLARMTDRNTAHIVTPPRGDIELSEDTYITPSGAVHQLGEYTTIGGEDAHRIHRLLHDGHHSLALDAARLLWLQAERV